MSSLAWRRIARWLLVIPVFASALFAAYISAEILMIAGNAWVQVLDRSRLNLSIHALLALQSVLQIYCLCAVWIIPTSLAAAFAAGDGSLDC